MDNTQFRKYQEILVGTEPGIHGRLATLLGMSEVNIKRYASGGREIPQYVAKSLRAMVLLQQKGLLGKLEKMA